MSDVRMRGFSARTRVETAWEWVAETAHSLPTEVVPLTEAATRVLGTAVISPLDVPAFDRSAMDGYAVRASETEGASDYNPLPFRLVGQSLPGRPSSQPVVPGTAVRIMTGAPLPAGADAVVPAEYAVNRSHHEQQDITHGASGPRAADQMIDVTAAVSPGKHVGRIGEDIRAGTELLPAGRRLRPQDIGVLASVGLPEVAVVRRPRVRLLVTGNELVRPGEPRGLHQIYEANSPMLTGLVRRDGGELESIRYLPDDRDAILAALTEPGADVLLVSGGSSVGAEDHAPTLVASVGTLDIHGLAMRPSSPAGLGRIGGALVFLLPGNPVSCLCAYDFFAGRAIRRLGGWLLDWPYRRQHGTLKKKIASVVGRVDYCRVRSEGRDVTPLAISGASVLSSTTRADGFVIVPAEHEGYGPGTDVDVFLYDYV